MIMTVKEYLRMKKQEAKQKKKASSTPAPETPVNKLIADNKLFDKRNQLRENQAKNRLIELNDKSK
jgi:hypothetical protein